MLTDPNLTLQIKLTDHVPVREIEIETEAKAPNVSLSNISEVAPFSEELQPAVDEQFITQLKTHGVYDQFVAKQPSDDPDIHITGFFSLSSIPQVNLIETNDFEDILNDLRNREQPLDLFQEQQNDEVIRELVLWKNRGNPDESPNLPLALRKYRKQFNRLVVENDILYRLFYDDCGEVKYKQFCVPKTLWREVVFRLHNSKAAGHFGIAKTVAEFRKRFYFPNFTEFFISSIKNCLTCLQLKRVPSKFLKTPLQPVSSLNSYPDGTLQIDLVGPLKSPVHRYVLTAIDVFTKYLFAVPVTNVRADTIARELTSIFFRHSYLPKTILSDLGTSFVSQLSHELTKLLEIQLDHASLKHPQTVGVVERSHSALKRILKLSTNEQWNDWFKYVQLATLIHNTSYHSAIGCSPTVLFHVREPIKPLDLRFNNTLIERFSPNSEYVIALQDAMNKKFSETRFKLTEMYNKYRAYYDCKAEAKPLALFSYCLLLNPKLMTQSDFASKSLPILLPLYRIEKILTNSNYIIRKVGTNYTQCVHRIRLRPVTPQGRIDDLTVINFENFQRDPSLGHYRGEPTLFDESIPSSLEPPTTVVATQNVTEDPPPVTVNIRFPITSAPVPVGLAAAPAPIPLPAVAAAPALMAPDTADVEAPEPQVLERPYLPTQDVRFSDSSDGLSTDDASFHAETLRDTPTHMNSGEQKLPAEAIPTDRQSPLRPLSRSQSSYAISGAGSKTSLNDSPRNITNAFKFEQGPLLVPKSTEAMPTVDQGTLRVSQNPFSHNDDSDSSVDSTRENSIYIRNFRTTVQSESQQAQSSSTDLPKSYDLRPRLPPRDYHEKVIQNKIPPKIRCIPITEPAATPNQLTQSQKRDAILDSCQRTRTLQANSVTQKDPNVHDKYTPFRHSAQSTPLGNSERQKEVKKR